MREIDEVVYRILRSFRGTRVVVVEDRLSRRNRELKEKIREFKRMRGV